MQNFCFESWWNNFSSMKFENGNVQLEILKSEKTGLCPDDQEVVIDELLKKGFVFFACGLIPQFGSSVQKRYVRDKLWTLLSQEQYNIESQEYINVVLKSYEDVDLELVRTYFSNTKSVKSVIPIELFNIDPDLFFRSFEMLISSLEDDILNKSEALSYLVFRPDAIRFLISNSSFVSSINLKS